MPNWCTTEIIFSSDNEEQLKEFYDEIISIYNSDATSPNGFGHGWLGDYVNTLLSPLTHESDIHCRGWIDYIDDSTLGGYFSIIEESSWTPALKIWRLIIDKYYPNINISYLATEPGCDLYCYCDDYGYFNYRYELDVSIESNGKNYYYHEYYSSTKAILEDLQKISDALSLNIEVEKFYNNHGFDSLETIFTLKLLELSESNFIYIHEYIEDRDFSD